MSISIHVSKPIKKATLLKFASEIEKQPLRKGNPHRLISSKKSRGEDRYFFGWHGGEISISKLENKGLNAQEWRSLRQEYII